VVSARGAILVRMKAPVRWDTFSMPNLVNAHHWSMVLVPI
jgi:hypothetical protein